MQDDEIVENFKSGDRTVFDELIERYQTPVYRTCFRFLSHKEDAEDATQEVFLKAYRALDRFQPDAKFSTWLYQIAVNHCLNVQRSRKRKAFISSLNPFNEYQVESKAALLEDANRPDKIHEKEERANFVRHAIDTLPENQKIAIILSRYEGLSYKEISEVTGSSVASVESRLYRAKTNLHRKLKSFF